MRAFSYGCLPIPLLLGGILISCADAPSRTDGVDVDAIPRLILVEEFRIGSIEDPNQGFSRIGSADVDNLGNIYVFEAADQQIRVYSERGEFLRPIGRRGQGPGEFPSSLVRFGLAGDTLWTWFGTGLPSDGGRITLFTTDGRVLGTSPLQTILWYDWDGNCSAIIPEMTGADSHIIGGQFPGITYARSCPARDEPAQTEQSTLSWPYVRFATDGSIIDTAGSYELQRSIGTRDSVRVGQHQYPAAIPPSDRPTRVTFSEGVYLLERPVATNPNSGHFVVVRQNFGGDTVFSRTYAYAPRSYSAIVLDSIAARYAPRTGRFQTSPTVPAVERTAQDSVAAQAAIRRAMSFPPFQPPIQATRVGRDGTLWLRREDMGESTFRWLLLDSTGVPRGEVELPRSGVQILWSQGDYLVAAETDDFGVPWLVRYRLE